ncbi:lytic murein transglycosylase [Alphaproteobacteria bacterium]|nr:lytic murein transglycosylase [Alphaproteobacteria bacterium]MDC1023348.1 lytic murein transglycosylase [Alphaproteobacteria bacterium]
MSIIRYIRIYFILIFILINCPFLAYSDVKFVKFINDISNEAEKKGVSHKIIKEFKKNAYFIPRVIELDRSQPEFKLTLEQYLKRVVTPLRIKKANKKYKENKILLNKISKHYGVQERFLVALWGIETDFGRLTGGFSVISSLASLAYDGRRHEYFKKELFNALKIINDGHIPLKKMTGSWAGAMGQCQFMPSSFLNYASDWDKDGTKNIWSSKPDVFASAANYLSKVGWSNKKTWGRKVFVGDNANKPKKKYLSLKKWSLKGVLNSDKTKLPQLNLKARLVIPDNYGKYGYLVYSNFESLLNWNRSNYFAIAVGKLSDSISEK